MRLNRFKQLLESKAGDVRPLLKESAGGLFLSEIIDVDENKELYDKIMSVPKSEENKETWNLYDQITGGDGIKVIYPFKYGNGPSKESVIASLNSFIDKSNSKCKISMRIPVYLITMERKKYSRYEIPDFFPARPILKYFEDPQEIISKNNGTIKAQSVGNNLYTFQGKTTCDYTNLFACAAGFVDFLCMLTN